MANASTTKNAAHQGVEKAKDTAHQAIDKGAEMANQAGSAVKSAVDTAGRKADEYAASAGSSVEAAGQQLRSMAPREGVLGQAADKAAGALEQTGKYLQEQGLTGMGEDLTEMIRRNPVPAVLVGIGVGFLLARATAPSSYSRS